MIRSGSARNPLVGVKAGGSDDALHIVERKGARYTLCGMYAETRNIEVLTSDVEVPVHSVCWTCVKRAQRVLEAA